MILASCSSTKRLARLLERHPLPERHDTVYIPGETIYIDTTVYRYLPGDTVEKKVYVDVPYDIPDTSIVAFTELASARAFLRDNQLGLWLAQYDTVFQWKLDSAIRINKDTVMVIQETTVPEYIKTGTFWRSGFLVLAGLIIIFAVLFFLLRR